MLCAQDHKSSFINLFFYWKYLYHSSLHFSKCHFNDSFCFMSFSEHISNLYYYFLLWPSIGSCSGSFCMDCTITNGTADGIALGYVRSFCIFWTCFSNSRGLIPSLAGTNDDEIQVRRSFKNISAYFSETCWF